MKIAIFGVGYVGLVTGVCLAEVGHNITLVGRDHQKSENLKKQIIPFYEPGLDKLIRKNIKKLHFTIDPKQAINFADVIFIAVGTPSNPDGSCDLSQVETVTKTIAKQATSSKIIVIKSTVPVGTDEIIRKILKTSKYKFELVSNPEFLREGDAISDFMNPDRIVIGVAREGGKVKNPKVLETMTKVYAKFKSKIFIADIKSAMLIKYGSNAFLATKISFINEMANLAENVGANITSIAYGMGLDSRIGKPFLNAGIGYGGSCFPKDVKELMHSGKNNGYRFKILDAVEEVNSDRKSVAVEKLAKKMDLKGKTVALLGLSFKPETDDMREASSLVIIDKLTKAGASIKAWDPIAEENCKRLKPNVSYFDTAYQALEGVDGAIIVTEWKQLKSLDLKKMKKLMKGAVVVDGRNVFDPIEMKRLGFDYQSIGR